MHVLLRSNSIQQLFARERRRAPGEVGEKFTATFEDLVLCGNQSQPPGRALGSRDARSEERVGKGAGRFLVLPLVFIYRPVALYSTAGGENCGRLGD